MHDIIIMLVPHQDGQVDVVCQEHGLIHTDHARAAELVGRAHAMGDVARQEEAALIAASIAAIASQN